MTKNDGGQAFPKPYGLRGFSGYGGMTLRDYFIAHAPEMSKNWGELWQLREKNKANNNSGYQMRSVIHSIIDWQIEYADAMIQERSKAERGER